MAAERSRIDVLAGQIATAFGEAIEEGASEQQMLSREATRGTASEAQLEAMGNGEDVPLYAVPLPEKLTPEGRWEVYR
jgi:hypothetical protein